MAHTVDVEVAALKKEIDKLTKQLNLMRPNEVNKSNKKDEEELRKKGV